MTTDSDAIVVGARCAGSSTGPRGPWTGTTWAMRRAGSCSTRSWSTAPARRASGATPARTVPSSFDFTYFRDLPTDGMRAYIRNHRAFGVMPSNDGLTLVVMGWPYAEAAVLKADVEGNFFATLDLVPEFGERARRATRVEPSSAARSRTSSVRRTCPGWALVGDAGVTRDPITAQGIGSAFADSERCSTAVDAWLRGTAAYDVAMDQFASVNAGTMSPGGVLLAGEHRLDQQRVGAPAGA